MHSSKFSQVYALQCFTGLEDGDASPEGVSFAFVIETVRYPDFVTQPCSWVYQLIAI